MLNTEKDTSMNTNIFLAEQKLKAQRKDSGTMWMLWIFLGGIGGHDFYLGKKETGIIKAAIWASSWFLVFPWFILFVWNIIDACGQMQIKLEANNNEVDMKLARLHSGQMSEAEILAIVYK